MDLLLFIAYVMGVCRHIPSGRMMGLFWELHEEGSLFFTQNTSKIVSITMMLALTLKEDLVEVQEKHLRAEADRIYRGSELESI